MEPKIYDPNTGAVQFEQNEPALAVRGESMAILGDGSLVVTVVLDPETAQRLNALGRLTERTQMDLVESMVRTQTKVAINVARTQAECVVGASANEPFVG